MCLAKEKHPVAMMLLKSFVLDLVRKGDISSAVTEGCGGSGGTVHVGMSEDVPPGKGKLWLLLTPAPLGLLGNFFSWLVD